MKQPWKKQWPRCPTRSTFLNGKIRENNYSIDINSYLDTEQREYSDIDSLKTEIEQLETELKKIRQCLDVKLKEIDNLD